MKISFSAGVDAATLFLILCLIGAATATKAQTGGGNVQNPTRVLSLRAPTPYAVVSRGANSAVWQRESFEQTPNGTVITNTHRYVELASGLNHLVNGQWVPSSEKITLSADGTSASATNGQSQVYFPGDIYNGVIKLVTPDGKTLRSQPIGLAYSDGSNSVLLAVVTNSTGEILPSGNQVLYPNAFAGLDASLLYTYTKAGFEQNVILREQPPQPAALGLNPQTTRLQVLTEFFNPPQPEVTASMVSTAAGNLENDRLSFGAMTMGQGKAFLIGTNSPLATVDKQWLTVAGRQFLIEEVPIVSVAKAIDSLSPFTAQAGAGIKYVLSRNLVPPPQRLTQTAVKTPFLTQATPPRRGLVIDYQTLTGTLNNYVFRSDTTYYLSGPVYVTGSNVFEGGAVLKYAYNAFLSSSGYPVISCQTGPYRPVIFTAKDDNTVGEPISGSTGTPTNYYASAAISFGPVHFASPLAHFRILYAQSAINVGSTTVTISDGQIVNCGTGIYLNGFNCDLNNVLFASNLTDISSFSGDLYVGNATFCNSSNWLGNALQTSIYCTNCIFANIANLTNGEPYISFTGDYNGFYNCREFGADFQSNDFYPFQSVGSGHYYLTNGCDFINAGTANIDPNLLADLRTTTTYPPQLLTNNIASDITLEPVAQRDTDIPDLGYHYSPLDYYVPGSLTVSATLTLTNGVAIGIAGQQTLTVGALNSQGTALNHNHLCPDYAVQESPTISENGNYFLNGGNIQARFTDFDMVGGYSGIMSASGNVNVRDCNFGAGWVNWYATALAVDNNVFEETPVLFLSDTPGAMSFHNNLFKGGYSVGFENYNTNATWTIEDNAFDGCGLYFSLQANDVLGYNAYINATGMSSTNSTDIILTNFNYATGPLGNYYQLSTNLLHMGSVTAGQLGLYHYTVQTNLYAGQEIPEEDSQVSIGFHYVAVDQYGNPLDSNGDGIPDYVEDANGNGSVDSGEIGWNIPNDPGLDVIITRPRNGSILP